MRLYREVVAQAIGSLIAHRFRAALTMLGISWGIVTVVLLMAYGTGFQRALMYGFRNAFSQGTVLVGNGQTSMQAGGERAGRREPLRPRAQPARREPHELLAEVTSAHQPSPNAPLMSPPPGPPP